MENLNRELGTWEQERNAQTKTVNWHFKSGDAREKLKSLYQNSVNMGFGYYHIYQPDSTLDRV